MGGTKTETAPSASLQAFYGSSYVDPCNQQWAFVPLEQIACETTHLTDAVTSIRSQFSEAIEKVEFVEFFGDLEHWLVLNCSNGHAKRLRYDDELSTDELQEMLDLLLGRPIRAKKTGK